MMSFRNARGKARYISSFLFSSLSHLGAEVDADARGSSGTSISDVSPFNSDKPDLKPTLPIPISSSQQMASRLHMFVNNSKRS
jgi:hypothetical protein